MNDFKAIFFERIERTTYIKSFRFHPERSFEFRPGQFVQVIFDEGNQTNRSLNKYLSFSSAPRKDYFELTKRISDSEFSKRLEALKKGKTVLFRGPLGHCVFKDDFKKIAFLIGGMGITPVMSILEYIIEKRLPVDVRLLYACRMEDDIAFRDDLGKMRCKSAQIKTILTVDCEKPQTKEILFGRIDKDLVLSQVPDYRERILFIFGPPTMVKTMNTICSELECPRENIRSEMFVGY